MKLATLNKNTKIVNTCHLDKNTEGEEFISDHVFSFQMTGNLTIHDGKNKYQFAPGDFRFSRRNSLLKFSKSTPKQIKFESISIYLNQAILREVYQEWKQEVKPIKIEGKRVLALASHPLYISYMESLLVYLNLSEEQQSAIMDLKIREAIWLLLRINPEIKEVLFDFSDPEKIDLKAFMINNFRFNVRLERFAYLTGRSLSTFKRDFEKIFETTPRKWLLEKRLEEAYFLIKEKGKKANAVYLDVGFENLSHFSHAFKQHFGINASELNHLPTAVADRSTAVKKGRLRKL
ncbi:helix-turn-helix domain-containing protein [Flavobacterium sp. JP2137]|uniref:helix-turn-helix domain-containing protein n=1 Tax=Flavobacterium sp. JP2137 TaxID=3414510 RepID=UPI003D2FC563